MSALSVKPEVPAVGDLRQLARTIAESNLDLPDGGRDDTAYGRLWSVDDHSRWHRAPRRGQGSAGPWSTVDSIGRGVVIGSAWRWTMRHVPSSRRNTVVTRNAIRTRVSDAPLRPRHRSNSRM